MVGWGAEAVGAAVAWGLGFGAAAAAVVGVDELEVAAGGPAQAIVPTSSAIASSQRTP